MKTLLLLGLLFPVFALAQSSETTDSLSVHKKPFHPIIFSEGYIGILGNESGGGVSLGGTLNWQFHKRDLLTTRVAYFGGFSQDYVLLSPFAPFPIIKDRERVREY